MISWEENENSRLENIKVEFQNKEHEKKNNFTNFHMEKIMFIELYTAVENT